MEVKLKKEIVMIELGGVEKKNTMKVVFQ